MMAEIGLSARLDGMLRQVRQMQVVANITTVEMHYAHSGPNGRMNMNRGKEHMACR